MPNASAWRFSSSRTGSALSFHPMSKKTQRRRPGSRPDLRVGRRRSGCPAIELSAGPQVYGTHRRCRSDLPGLGKRPGLPGPGGQRVRAIPQPEKGTAMTIVDTRAITGGVDTHADVHVAAALDPIGGLLGVQEFPATPAGYGQLLGWLAR